MANGFEIGSCWEENEQPEGVYRITADDEGVPIRQFTLELVQPHINGVLDPEINVPALTLLQKWHLVECPPAPA